MGTHSLFLMNTAYIIFLHNKAISPKALLNRPGPANCVSNLVTVVNSSRPHGNAEGRFQGFETPRCGKLPPGLDSEMSRSCHRWASSSPSTDCLQCRLLRGRRPDLELLGGQTISPPGCFPYPLGRDNPPEGRGGPRASVPYAFDTAKSANRCCDSDHGFVLCAPILSTMDAIPPLPHASTMMSAPMIILSARFTSNPTLLNVSLLLASNTW